MTAAPASRPGARRVLDRRLLAESLPARRLLVGAVLSGLLAAVLVVAQAGLLTEVIVGASAGRPPRTLVTGLAVLLLVVLARAVLTGLGESAARRSADAVTAGLRARLLAAAVHLGPARLGRRRPGELTALVTHGLDGLDEYVARFLPQLALAVLVPPVVLIRIGLADWPSAVILAVTAPLIPVFMAVIGRYSRARTARQWRLLAALGGHFLDVVEGLPTLKVFGRARAQVGIIRRVSESYRTATMATLRIAFTSALALELLATLGTALVAVAVGLRLLDGGMSYSAALLVLLLAPEVYLPLRALGGSFHASAGGVAAAAEAYRVLDEPGAATAATARGLLPSSAAEVPVAPVTLRDVTVTYPGRDRPALDRVGFTVPAGALLALTGASGTGKSSVLSLIMRFAEPSAGEILVGDRRLDELPPSAWRAHVGWVPQAPYLFAGTVADNVRLGDPEATEADVRRALAQAEAADFVAELPGGLQTQVGERGLRLSGGQRQRIALARAFLRDAPLLLLDEPTAHLDPISAAGIVRTVERLMAGRTVLLVTHHRRWLDVADAVVTLDRGRLLARERTA